jgi:type III restriction enzyme
VAIVKRWLSECVTIHDQAFTQLLLLLTQAHAAADRIFASISATTSGSPVLHPILRPRCPCGSTRGIDFETTRSVYATRADKCHVSHVVAETASPVRKLAQSLEEMDEVVRYVNNRRLGLTIPYTFQGEAKEYAPDFIACVDDGHGDNDLLNVLIDLAGAKRVEERARVAARTLWLPAVNHHGGFGRWDFVEADGSSGAAVAIRAHVCDR